MKFHFRSLPAKTQVFGISAMLALLIVSAISSPQQSKVSTKAQVAPLPPGGVVCLGSACTTDTDCHNTCGIKEICANAGPVVPPSGGLCVPIVCDKSTGVGVCMAGKGTPPTPFPSITPVVSGVITPLPSGPITLPMTSVTPPLVTIAPPTVTEFSMIPKSFTPPVPPATSTKICLEYFKCSDSDVKIDGSTLNGKIPMSTVTTSTYISGKLICSNVKNVTEYTEFGSSAKRAMMAYCASRIPPSPTPAPSTSPVPNCKPSNLCATKSIGDANCDGVVSVVDFEILRGEISGEKASCEANFDGFNGVDMNDYRIWYLTVQGIK